MASRRRINKGRSRKVKQHQHSASCKHNKFKSVSLEKINGKCYKNSRKISCSQFVKEERQVEKSIGTSISSFLDMFKMK